MTRRLAAAWILAASASCYDPDVKLGVPCSDQGDCPTGQECNLLTNTCASTANLATWREDTAADFMQPGAALTDAVVEPAGFVGPTPYIVGRVKLTGIGSDVVGDLANASWTTAGAAAPTGVGFGMRPSFDVASGIPPGLGLTAGDGISVLVEGEIELDATGMWQFRLRADDKGFMDLAPPGGDFTRLVSDNNKSTTASYTVTTAGWYRFRIALADVSQAMSLALDVDSPVVPGGFRSVDPEHLRARGDGLQGWLIDGFDDALLLDYDSSTLGTQPIAGALTTDPFGLSVGTAGFSLRWSGQVLIDTAGAYAFDVTSFHGHRLFIDGTKVLDAFEDIGTISNTTAPIELGVGWHDVVLDVTKTNTSMPGEADLTVAAGPAWVGQSIPIDHVRPLLARSQRWVGSNSNSTTTIPDGASVSRNQSFTPPADFTPDWIAVGAEIDHPLREQVGVTVLPPASGAVTLIAPGDASGPGAAWDYATLPLTSYATTYPFTASDNALDAQTGTLSRTSVTVTGRGGPAPFPTTSRYESAVHELGDIVSFGALMVQARQGAVAKVELRTCADAAGCAGAPWVDVTSGDLSAVTPAPFAQYAVSLTSDGDVPTALDWFQLQYVTAN